MQHVRKLKILLGNKYLGPGAYPQPKSGQNTYITRGKAKFVFFIIFCCFVFSVFFRPPSVVRGWNFDNPQISSSPTFCFMHVGGQRGQTNRKIEDCQIILRTYVRMYVRTFVCVFVCMYKKCSKNVQKMFKNVQKMFKKCSKNVQKMFKKCSKLHNFTIISQ